MPPPKGDPDAPLKALIFDSWFDAYRGVVIVDPRHRRRHPAGHEGPLMVARQDYEVEALGVFSPKAAGDRRSSAPARSASSSPASRT